MSDLDKAIGNFFGNTEKITLKTLFEEVEKALDVFDLQPLSETKEGTDAAAKTKKTILGLLPRFEISENWGQKDNTARKEFEKYMINIKGKSIHQKLAYIRAFTNRHDPSKYQVHEILSNLMFLDMLSIVVNNFSPSGAGFLFEAFMAGLLRGTQAIEKHEGVLQIEDFLNAEGEPFSLKLLVPGTNVKGSTRNLLSFLANHPKGAEGIEYLAVYKFGKETTKSLSFYSFTIDHTNIYYWLSDSMKGFDVTLKEARVGAVRQASIDKYKREQESTLKYITAATAGRMRATKSALSLMATADGVRGAKILRRYGKEEGVFRPDVKDPKTPEEAAQGDEQYLSPSPDELHRISEEDPDFFQLIRDRRKELHGRIKAIVPASHPLGSVLRQAEFAGGEEKEASVIELIALYNDDPEAWEQRMIALMLPSTEPAEGEEDPDDEGAPAEASQAITEGASGKTQFNINSSLILSKKLPELYKKVWYGELVVERAAIEKIANLYASQLRDALIPVLEQLGNLVAGVTGYFASESKDRGPHGKNALEASVELKRIFTEKEIGVPDDSE